MNSDRWSRSRFWLCHFLHNRHVRTRINWSAAAAAPAASPITLRPLLSFLADRAGRMAGWIVQDAEILCPKDPAFIQCLRLWVKEEQYLSKIAGRWLSLAGDPAPVSLGVRCDRLSQPVRRFLGIRFEISCLLLGDLLESVGLRMVRPQIRTSPLGEVLDQILRDREQHLAFAGEWLTREFADFNFFRRNLRRLRLRGMFLFMLLVTLLVHYPTLKSAGIAPTAYLREAWQSFSRLLETMVPYRRDELLARLLSQKERPYDKPARMG